MKLFEPIQLRNIVIPNRIVMSPMCMYSATDGMANDFHYVHYGCRAQGGTGLIIVEATGIEPRGRITNKCLGIWNDEQAQALKKIVDFVHQHSDSKIGIQLAHAGRKGSTWEGKQISLEEGWETIAPSAIPYHPGERLPHPLSKEEIQQLVRDFQAAARRAVEVGFDVIEIHAAHGYLIHQFLSPLSNQRSDEYGGSFENRILFLLEIVEAINLELSQNQALFVRISGTEYSENGWDIDDSVKLAEILKTQNVDLIDVSSGGNIHGAKITLFDGYQVPLSEKIKDKAKIRTGAVGLITSSHHSEEILRAGKADLIFLGRELLRNPYFAIRSAFEENQNCYFPPQYERGKPKK